MRKIIPLIGPLAICLMLFAGVDALAKPDKNKGKGKGRSHQEYGDHEYGEDNEARRGKERRGRGAGQGRGHSREKHAVRHHGGPPPWAPAHGYRSRHRGGVGQTAYVAPYGIDGGHCSRKEVGMIVGGVTGGLIGSKVTSREDRTAGIIGGAILGAVVGGIIGNNMDKTDQHCVGQALEHAPDSQSVAWSDPDNGARYQVTPVQTYEASGGGYCREYQTVSTLNGRSQETYGTACRQEDGAWKLMN